MKGEYIKGYHLLQYIIDVDVKDIGSAVYKWIPFLFVTAIRLNIIN